MAEHLTTLLVSADTPTKDAAGAIAHHLRAERVVYIQAIGAAAVNQTVKALALAERFLLEEGLCVISRVQMTKVCIRGRERNAVRWLAWRAKAP